MPKFLVANYETGKETDLEPWLIPEDAFPILEGMYVWRGRVRRQPGFSLLGRLVEIETPFVINTLPAPVETGTLPVIPVSPGSVVGTGGGFTFTDDGNGNLIVGPPAALNITDITQTNPAVVTSAGHPFINGQLIRITGVTGMIQVNNDNYTVANAAVNTFEINFDGTTADAYQAGGLVNWVGTINYATGDITFSSSILGIVAITFLYNTLPCLPVMGLGVRETANLNFEQLIAFDTRHANLFDTATNQFLDITFTALWTGGDSDFFWSTNFARDGTDNRLFWATNNLSNNVNALQDRIKYFNGGGWVTQTALLTATVQLKTCLMIIPYRNRLVCLNTLEGVAAGPDFRFPNRARWSQDGTPVTALDGNAWRQDIAGRGGALNAPTSQAIVSAEFVRDTLIVFFERSTYRLAYTGSDTQPFQWEKINTELGAESTFSVVPFDNGIYGVGDKGIVTANSSSLIRIDEKIPDTVFKIHNLNQGPQRVHGVRDYRREFVYWTYPPNARNNGSADNVFPSKLLAYNYREHSYSVFEGSFTTLGSFQSNNQRIWATSNFPWASASFAWNDPNNNARFNLIVGGNQQGFVHVFEDQIQNSECLKIEAVTVAAIGVFTSTNHNLDVGSFIQISNAQGMIGLNGVTYKVLTVESNDTFTLGAPPNINDPLDTSAFTPYVPDSAEITCIYNFRAVTKRFNPFITEDQQIDVPYLDLLVDADGNGEVSLNVYVDGNATQTIQNLFTNEAQFRFSTSAAQTLLGNVSQDKIWIRVFVHSHGQFVQYEFYLTEDQMLDSNIQIANFTLHAMMLNAEPQGRLI